MHVQQLLAVSPVLKRVECSYKTRNRDRSALMGHYEPATRFITIMTGHVFVKHVKTSKKSNQGGPQQGGPHSPPSTTSLISVSGCCSLIPLSLSVHSSTPPPLRCTRKASLVARYSPLPDRLRLAQHGPTTARTLRSHILFGGPNESRVDLAHADVPVATTSVAQQRWQPI